ncbi:hypothetical protein B0H17DRAFT_1068437 [Mycena rosella]|uniref:Uncharacterized protein n=1 Tax=Mycena rosella TaxID=1033263 RepID=A0AAD7GGV9_MYCRO|nr:hypothetical protein B0H17DRAFT_1068437 [Mycena rosella]
MSATAPRPYKPYPWPWGQPSVLAVTEEPRNSWLDTDLAEPDDTDSDYAHSEASESTDETSDGSDPDISDSELAEISADAQMGSPSSPTPSQKRIQEREDLARQIAELVKAEQDASAAYDPDVIVALVAELYKLLITMGHWPEGSLHYSPHTKSPVNMALAAELGYAPSAISLMQKLPYMGPEANRDNDKRIIPRTRFADYTLEEDLKEGRHPYPYKYLDGCPDLDPWMIPLAPQTETAGTSCLTRAWGSSARTTPRVPQRKTQSNGGGTGRCRRASGTVLHGRSIDARCSCPRLSISPKSSTHTARSRDYL